jgi:hypothetical protein
MNPSRPVPRIHVGRLWLFYSKSVELLLKMEKSVEQPLFLYRKHTYDGRQLADWDRWDRWQWNPLRLTSCKPIVKERVRQAFSAVLASGSRSCDLTWTTLTCKNTEHARLSLSLHHSHTIYCHRKIIVFQKWSSSLLIIVSLYLSFVHSFVRIFQVTHTFRS